MLAANTSAPHMISIWLVEIVDGRLADAPGDLVDIVERLGGLPAVDRLRIRSMLDSSPGRAAGGDVVGDHRDALGTLTMPM